MKKYKVTLIYKEQYEFDEIEAKNEEDAEQQAIELAADNSSCDYWLYDSKVKEE